jgi:hypothetical protein
MWTGSDQDKGDLARGIARRCALVGAVIDAVEEFVCLDVHGRAQNKAGQRAHDVYEDALVALILTSPVVPWNAPPGAFS